MIIDYRRKPKYTKPKNLDYYFSKSNRNKKDAQIEDIVKCAKRIPYLRRFISQHKNRIKKSKQLLNSTGSKIEESIKKDGKEITQKNMNRYVENISESIRIIEKHKKEKFRCKEKIQNFQKRMKLGVRKNRIL